MWHGVDVWRLSFLSSLCWVRNITIMYSHDELFLCSLMCYFGVYFPRCFTSREINTKITFSWALKQFVIHVYTSFSIRLDRVNSLRLRYAIWCHFTHQHQTITWTNVEFLSVGPSGIYLRTFSWDLDIPKRKKNKIENHIFKMISSFPGDKNLWNIELHNTCVNLKTVYKLKTKPKIR